MIAALSFASVALIPVLAPPALAAGSRAQAEALVTQEQLEAWTTEILADIEALRATEFPRAVSVAVSDAAKLREYMRERTDKTTTPERRAADELVAKLLGTIPAELDLEHTMNEMLDAQVGGFYDPDTEGFYLMDRFDGFLARTILAHELTHALDDQLYDIDGTLAKFSGNADAELAYMAVVEGSGTAVMNAWSIERMAELDPAELKNAMNGPQLGMESLENAQPALWKPLMCVYMRGAAFLNRTPSVFRGQVRMPELADFEAAFTHPPRSSEQVLHPEKYWDEEQRDEPIAVNLDTSALLPGWSLAYANTLGELGWGLVVEPPKQREGLKGQLGILAVKYTSQASAGWGGDRFALLTKGDACVLVCATVWDTPKDAREFAQSLGEDLRAHLEGSARAVARERGVRGAGAEVLRAEDERQVGVLIWAGVEAQEAERLRQAVTVRVDLEAPRR